MLSLEWTEPTTLLFTVKPLDHSKITELGALILKAAMMIPFLSTGANVLHLYANRLPMRLFILENRGSAFFLYRHVPIDPSTALCPGGRVCNS